LLPRPLEALTGSWVIDINQVIEPVISGCAVSCGAVLVVAGASKLYRGARNLDDMTAIRRALRMPRRQWRLFGLTAGGVECVTGALVCSGAYPVLGGASMAALGAVFCVLLTYVLVKQVPGGCGCIRWRTALDTAAEAVTWRAVARSGMLFGLGIAYMIVSADATDGHRWAWFGGGVVVSGAALMLLSMDVPVRTPVCRRPLWRQTRSTLRVLASHEMFAAMAASAGPFEPVAQYRRAGCTDEFWFTAATGQDRQAVVFQVHQAAPGTRLAVHTSLRDARTPGTSWPTRAITVADVLTEMSRGARGSDQPRSRQRPALTTAGWTHAAPASRTGFPRPIAARRHLRPTGPRSNGGRRNEVSGGQ
jgi:Methylamine utilisation protein MauE